MPKPKKKKTYFVSIPIAGSITFEVQANDPKSAEAAAWAKYHKDGPESAELEWEALGEITTGNVCHAPQNSIEVSEA